MKKMITKTTLLFMLSVSFAMSIQAQGVSGVALLGKDTITLGVDSTAILTAIVSPSNAADKSVVWMTTNKLVVDTVSVEDAVCNIKGTGVGQAKIIVRTNDGNFRDTCVVNVVIPVDSVRIKDIEGDRLDSMDMILGRDTVLKSKIYPSEPTNGEMIWTSSEPSMISIVNVTDDSICAIKALKLGVATIFVTSVDGAKKDSCVVTVNALPIESFTLSSDSIKYMRLGSDTTLTARVEPFGHTNDSVRWTSADYEIVEITSSGYDTVCNIKAKGIGATYIYAVSVVDRATKDSCYVSVVGIPVTGVSLNTDSLDLEIRTDTTLIARMKPSDATNDSIHWTSSDSATIDIISVESMKNDTVCAIRAKKSGGAYIYAQTFEGAYKDSCFVTVIVPVDSVVLSSLAVRINLKDDTTALLKAKIYPDSATQSLILPLEWINKDEQLVRIDSVRNDTLCYIKALAAGVDTIYAVTANGVESKWCYVTVDPRLADSVRITKNNDPETQDTLFIGVDSSVKLQIAVYPSNVTNDTLTLTSSAPDILKIDSLPDGTYVSALREGTATVYAVATDGSLQKDSCIVKVRNVPATGISLNVDTLYIFEENVDSIIATVLPLNATDKSITWRRDSDADERILEVQPTDNDSVYKFKALKADTVLIYAYAGSTESGIKDSCVVIVKEQFVFVEADIVEVDGRIKMSLRIPEDATFRGSFELQLPKGFGLTKDGDGYKSKLSDAYKDASELKITPRDATNDSIYLFEISPKTAPASSSLRTAQDKREALNIYYTIYDNALENSTETYDVRFADISFRLSDGSDLEEKLLKLKVKVFKDETGNVLVESEKIITYVKEHRLYVNTAKAETVYVYAPNGSLILVKDKAEGQAMFSLNTDYGILFVKGSSGWTRKVVNQ
ncbi:MAG: Ig-like domain-containing protein [Tannerella sp.]|jgi:uncharacterized protein YjdB|nr:Ig-like domain-containing protein [Tannerella sp.]